MAKDKDAKARRRKERLKRDRLSAEAHRRERQQGLTQMLDFSARGLAEVFSRPVAYRRYTESGWGMPVAGKRLPVPAHYAFFDGILNSDFEGKGTLRSLYSAMLALTLPSGGQSGFAMIVSDDGVPSFESLHSRLFLDSPDPMAWLRWTMEDFGGRCTAYWGGRWADPDYPDGTCLVMALDSDGRQAFWIIEATYPIGGAAPQWHACSNSELITERLLRPYGRSLDVGDLIWREWMGVDAKYEGPKLPTDQVWADAARRMQGLGRSFLLDIVEGAIHVGRVSQLEAQLDEAGDRLLEVMLRNEKLEAELSSSRRALEQVPPPPPPPPANASGAPPRTSQSIAERLELFFRE